MEIVNEYRFANGEVRYLTDTEFGRLSRTSKRCKIRGAFEVLPTSAPATPVLYRAGERQK
jgi:hypothetical protein